LPCSCLIFIVDAFDPCTWIHKSRSKTKCMTAIVSPFLVLLKAASCLMIIESLMSRKYAVAVLHCFPWNYTIVLLNFYYIIALVALYWHYFLPCFLWQRLSWMKTKKAAHTWEAWVYSILQYSKALWLAVGLSCFPAAYVDIYNEWLRYEILFWWCQVSESFRQLQKCVNFYSIIILLQIYSFTRYLSILCLVVFTSIYYFANFQDFKWLNVIKLHKWDHIISNVDIFWHVQFNMYTSWYCTALIII